MDISQLNSVATSGMPAAKAVASALAPHNATSQVTPKSSTPSTNGTPTNGSGSSDITANDFLTLLVSELKNQDPTQPTDPNQYITQLAQVNSLQQLISINQGIGTLDGALPTPSTTPTSNTGSGS
jgi:flagellar basal-body rod modification protein FlgD